MIVEKIGQLLQDVTGWAAVQHDIQAVALVGSQARNAATQQSDVDLVILATNPDTYLQDTRWAAQFGEIRQQQIEDYGKLISLRVWYADGREVEYGLTDESWAALPLDEGTQQVISDGMRVLYERKPLLSRHLPGA